jgi:hypothetical protein
MPRGGCLYYASFYGFYDLVEHLAARHAEHVNARGGRLVSPLGVALYGGHFEVAELLHGHGADVGATKNVRYSMRDAMTPYGGCSIIARMRTPKCTTAGPRCIWQLGTTN